MGRMTWHQATPQPLEPVGPDRDYGTGVPRRIHRAAPGRRHRNTAAVSPYNTGVGPDQPRSQPAWLTQNVTSPATVLICLSTRPLTSPESGAEVRTVDQCSTHAALNETLRALFAVIHIITPHRFGSYIRDDRAVRVSFCQLHNVEYKI